MSIKLTRLSLALAFACAAIGCNQQQQAAAPAAPVVAPAAATPDAAVKASLQALRSNNIGALLDNSLPTAQLAKIKADWNKDLNKDPITDEDRKKFAEGLAKLTAPDAEAKLYAEIEPKLKEADAQMAQQMPMMIAMGQGMLQSSVQQSKDLDDKQKEQATAAIAATAAWAQKVKFTDPALVKQAIAVGCKTARDINVKTLDEARALTYDQGMQKAGIVLGGVKQVFEVYGFSIDKTLDSAKVETVTNQGDAAKIKLSYTLFDTPLSSDSDMVKVDGRWYGKQALEQFNKLKQEAAAAEAAKTAAPAPAAAAPAAEPAAEPGKTFQPADDSGLKPVEKH